MEETPAVIVFCNPPVISDWHRFEDGNQQPPSKKLKPNPDIIQWERKLYRHQLNSSHPSPSLVHQQVNQAQANSNSPSIFEYINTVLDHDSNLQKEFDQLMRGSQMLIPGICSQSIFHGADQITCSSSSNDVEYLSSWNDSVPIDNFNSVPDTCDIEQFSSSTYSSCDSIEAGNSSPDVNNDKKSSTTHKTQDDKTTAITVNTLSGKI